MMKIAIIDGPLNMKLLHDKFPNVENIISQDIRFSTCSNEITHGTICSSILIRQLEKELTCGQISIIYFALKCLDNGFSLDRLIKAIKRAHTLGAHIISLSLGTNDRSTASDFIDALAMDSTRLVVAAASNDLKITYPAALKNVLGVKRAKKEWPEKYEWQLNPIDGVELIAQVDDITKETIQQISGYNKHLDSNSFLVPQVCSFIARKAIEKNIEVKKENVCLLLTEEKPIKRTKESFCFSSKRKDNIPIILLSYSSTDKNGALTKAIRIQKEFGDLGYPCSLISDLITTNCFVEGQYSLFGENAFYLLKEYSYIISDSLILLVRNKGSEPLPFDFCVESWRINETSIVVKEILKHFNEEED